MKTIKEFFNKIRSTWKSRADFEKINSNLIVEISANNNKWNKEIVNLFNKQTAKDACVDHHIFDVSDFTNTWNKFALATIEIRNDNSQPGA